MRKWDQRDNLIWKVRKEQENTKAAKAVEVLPGTDLFKVETEEEIREKFLQKADGRKQSTAAVASLTGQASPPITQMPGAIAPWNPRLHSLSARVAGPAKTCTPTSHGSRAAGDGIDPWTPSSQLKPAPEQGSRLAERQNNNSVTAVSLGPICAYLSIGGFQNYTR